MQRRTTSHDVARLAGVSQSTVSLVLNGRTDMRIPDATRQRVFTAARQLNYTRNAAAHALQTGRTHRIGVVPITPRAFMDHGAYYGTLMTSFIEGAMRHDQNLLLHSAEHAQWEGLYRDILGGGADGVILIGRNSDDPLTAALMQARFPTVTVSYQPDLDCFYSVDCDNEEGGYLCVRHLLSLGHRHIGFVQPHPRLSWEQQRCAGAQHALMDADLPADSLQRLPFPEWPTADNTLLKQFLEQPVSALPTAIICRDEGQAAWLARQFQQHGLRVPQDIALVAFNSTEVSDRADPPITSVWQPLVAIGEAAVNMLIDLIEGKEVKQGTKRFPMRLDIRKSCGAHLADMADPSARRLPFSHTPAVG